MAAKPGAAYGGRASPEAGNDAAAAFQQFGEANLRLLELQAQAAAGLLLDSAVRCTEVVNEVMRSFGWHRWERVQRSQMRSITEPMLAWIDAATGLQAVVAAAAMQALALAAFPGSRGMPAPRIPERRLNAVVIPFPDRRHGRSAL